MALPTQEYLRTTVMTASAEMLTLMLWDGAIRFSEQGREAIIKKDIEGTHLALTRAQRIVMELNAGLKHDVNPDLCGKLAALYNFMYRRLVDANLQKDPKLVEDALAIMRHQRETWVLLMDKLGKVRAAEASELVNANVDSVATSDELPTESPALPVAPAPAINKPAPARRGYPTIAVRPAAAQHAPLSVQG